MSAARHPLDPTPAELYEALRILRIELRVATEQRAILRAAAWNVTRAAQPEIAKGSAFAAFALEALDYALGMTA